MDALQYLALEKDANKLTQEKFDSIEHLLTNARSMIFNSILYSAAKAAVDALHTKKIFDIDIFNNTTSDAYSKSILVDINDAENIFYDVLTPSSFQDSYLKSVTKFDRFKKKFVGNKFYRIVLRYEFWIMNFTEFVIYKKLIKCVSGDLIFLDSSYEHFKDAFNFDIFMSYRRLEYYCNVKIPTMVAACI